MATFVRALVMLAVLVGLPAAWIYYGPLPSQAQRAVDRFVSAAKETVGWNKPSPPAAIDSTEVNGQIAAPAIVQGGATGSTAAGDHSSVPQFSEAPALIPPKAATFAERVEPLLATLRQHGVVEYALERWGDGGKLYRFSCEMPLGASAELTQQFEAVAADPQLSVEQVVAEVSQWQLTQHAGM